ncbi:MAG: hypothetical protein DRP01_11435, partial [Archaeoglobales archaeon]
MRKILLLIFLVLPLANAQQWAITYGGSDWDEALLIQETDDGGYIVAGSTESFGAGGDFWVLKLNENGNVEWQKTYGGSDYDRAESIQQTDDGGYIVAGSTYSFGAGWSDFWVLKLDEDGNVEWQKTYGGSGWDEAYSIQQTSDGGYIVAGVTDSFGAGGDFWILKLNESGYIEWQKTYGGSDYDYAWYIQQTNDGGYIVAGYTKSFGAGYYDFWVLKLNESGYIEWQKTYGGSSDDFAKSIQQTDDGGYIVAGFTGSFGAGGGDFWILKLNESGNVEWQKTYGGSDYDRAESIQQTSDGGYIVAGSTHSFGAGLDDFWVLKLNENGNVEWQKTYGGSDYDRAESIRQTDDGGYIVAGFTGSFGAGGGDFWILKLDEKGEIPNCPYGNDTYAEVNETQVSPINTSATVRDTNVDPQETYVDPIDTDCEIRQVCPLPPPKAEKVPALS